METHVPRLNVHLDTDLGGDSDDLCALAWLLRSPLASVVGVTTDTDFDGRRVLMTEAAIELAGHPMVPIWRGAAGVIGGFGMEMAHGDLDRYWPTSIADSLKPTPQDSSPPSRALGALAAAIASGDTIVGIGPWTNLALLEVLRPGSLANANLVLMGGCIRSMPAGFPDWHWDYDYNIQQDAEAAAIVLENSDPILVPVEMTIQFALTESDAQRLILGDDLCQVLARQAKEYAIDNDHAALAAQYSGLPRDLLNFQHDALACMAAVGVDGISVERLPLEIRREGRLLRLIESPNGRPTRVVTKVDVPMLRERWIDTVLLENL